MQSEMSGMGDRKEAMEFEQLIDQYSGYIYSIISRVVKQSVPREDIEECASDVLLAIWRSRDRYDPSKGGYKQYIAAIARNAAIQRLRRAIRQPEAIPLEEDMLTLSTRGAAEEYERGELSALVQEAVQSLPPPDPEIFYRRYLWGDSLDEIGKRLGLTRRAVEGRLYRGRQSLKEWLEGRLNA